MNDESDGIIKLARDYLGAPAAHQEKSVEVYRHLAQDSSMFEGFSAEDRHLHRPLFVLGLLSWGLSQSWGAMCDIKSVLNHWRNNVSGSTSQGNARAAAMLADFQHPLHESARLCPALSRQLLLAESYPMIEAFVPWAQFSSYKPGLLSSTVLTMGAMVDIGPKKLQKIYLGKMTVAVETMDLQERRDWLARILESPLRQKTKHALAAQLPAVLWLEDLMPVALSALLDPDEAKRFAQLNWSEDAPTNRQLCWTYCPGVFDYANLHAPSLDWTAPKTALGLVSRFANERPTAPAIPSDLFSPA